MKKLEKSKIRKYRLLVTSKYTIMFAPIIGIVIANWNTYFTKTNGVQVSMGMILALGVGVVMLRKEANLFKGITGYLIFFLLAFLLKTILTDLWLISLCALGGKTASMVFEKPINDGKQEIKIINETTIKERTKKLIEKEIDYGNGRV